MKIAHLADLHLGYRAYHRVNQRGMNVREADVAEAFRQAVARVIELRPELVLVAGDVFHTVRPSNTAIADAFRQFSLLADRLPDVPIVVIAGNHDSPRSSDTGNILRLFEEIDGVRVVCDECKRLRLEELETSVWCEPHVASFTEDPPRREPDPAARHNLMMLHGMLVGPRGAEKLTYISEYGGANIDETSIRWPEWDYIALGHHHSCQEIERNAWYAGGLERTSTNIWAEKEEKGFLVYDTDARQAEFHAVETRTMVDLPRISAREMTPAELDEAILRAVSRVEDGLKGKIVRLLAFDVPRGVVRELNHKRIRDWKAEAVHFHLDARPPEIRRRAGSGAPVRRQTMREQVAGFLEQRWEIQDKRVERERLVELGTRYVDRTVEEG